uniref:Uncharacterized protein n=1 Tax=Chromera velia CCMP2878 TaxID=1169474 RepID=A0A0G4H3M7_9ALVE|eukprot:Cvel_24577.t1-p1 / transcript=Cvel_24577.t1 / gene=Cvel_24577 / organism=Chromera_velia_CCMP2878 / gene_product=hypothetical protein / transcript_product=hypothetical protein / location=Cvel_scaffold2675:2300-4482(+) / protein_length=405 / sequence_SO=supercontig / SO=protein_coding / is_pseudo=false
MAALQLLLLAHLSVLALLQLRLTAASTVPQGQIVYEDAGLTQFVQPGAGFGLAPAQEAPPVEFQQRPFQELQQASAGGVPVSTEQQSEQVAQEVVPSSANLFTQQEQRAPLLNVPTTQGEDEQQQVEGQQQQMLQRKEGDQQKGVIHISAPPGHNIHIVHSPPVASVPIAQIIPVSPQDSSVQTHLITVSPPSTDPFRHTDVQRARWTLTRRKPPQEPRVPRAHAKPDPPSTFVPCNLEECERRLKVLRDPETGEVTLVKSGEDRLRPMRRQTDEDGDQPPLTEDPPTDEAGKGDLLSPIREPSRLNFSQSPPKPEGEGEGEGRLQEATVTTEEGRAREAANERDDPSTTTAQSDRSSRKRMKLNPHHRNGGVKRPSRIQKALHLAALEHSTRSHFTAPDEVRTE